MTQPKDNAAASIHASNQQADPRGSDQTTVKLVRRNGASGRPYLSVVVTTRNDDHGVGILRRTQIFVDGLASQANRHRLDIELVLVEWNPPGDRRPMSEALTWPQDGGYFSARIVTVPEDVHRRLAHSDRLPLFQMIAKNVGIRRAHGEFVLATNVDLLFSDELMAFLSRRSLRRDRLYRVDRYDAAADVPYPAPVSEQLAWCDAHLLRVCRREGTYDLIDNRFYRIYEDTRFPLWTAPWLRLLRNSTRFPVLIGGRTVRRHGRPRRLLGPAEMSRRLAKLPGRARSAVAAVWSARIRDAATPRDAGSRLSLLQLLADVRAACSWNWEEMRLLFADERARMRLHTNACGDFTLTSRDAWSRSHAYPELEVFSMHIDSLFMYQAHYHGITEEFLPFRVYHIEHSEGFRPDDESVDELNSHLEDIALPQISNSEFLRWVIEMRKTVKPRFDNDPTWGFSDLVFGEQTVVEPAATTPKEIYA